MTARMSGRRLAVILGLTALPVFLTSAALRLVASPPGAVAPGRLRPPYRDFAVYALANWITLALVVRVAGWHSLHAWGLRARMSRWSGVSACAGFVIGLAIYMAVSAALRRLGLPPIRGMAFASPTAFELAVMFFSVVVTAAFCEEVFFRVLWVGALRSFAPAWMTAVASIAAFAAIHYPYFGPGGVLFISVWALVPLGLFLWFGDCTASIAMHMMNNAFAYLLVPVLFAVPK